MPTKVNIGAYKTRFNGRMGAFKKGVLIKLFAAVIKDTPVLTGRLRGNWTFGKGSPQEAVGESTLDPTETVVGGINAGVTAGDDSYFLTNTMPYTNRIEYEGWSHTKAPEGMVRRNLVRIAALLELRGREFK